MSKTCGYDKQTFCQIVSGGRAKAVKPAGIEAERESRAPPENDAQRRRRLRFKKLLETSFRILSPDGRLMPVKPFAEAVKRAEKGFDPSLHVSCIPDG
jgi:hypothetical protein